MRIYIAHRLTGEDLPALRTQLELVSDIIAEAGHEPFIFCRDIQGWVPDSMPMRQIYEQCLVEIDKSDMIFVFAHSDEKSEGMLIECGYAKGKNKEFIIAVREGMPEHWLKHLGEKSFQFKDMHDLGNKMREVL